MSGKQSGEASTVNRIIFLDIISFFLVILFIGLFNYDHVMLVLLITIYPYLKWTGRLRLFVPFGLAIVMSIIWGSIAADQYEYSLKGLQIGFFNLYPVFFWTFGLFVVKLIYSSISRRFENRGFMLKMLIFSSLFWAGLIAAESIVYHVFGVKNLATSGNAGLPLIDAIHAPPWMQICYFLMGPLYFMLIELTERKIVILFKRK